MLPSELEGECSQNQSFALRLCKLKSRGGKAGEGGMNLLEFLCKMQLKALGIIVLPLLFEETKVHFGVMCVQYKEMLLLSASQHQ